MLTKLMGALLILLSAGGVGLRHSRELRARVHTLDALLRGVERLRFEICRLQTPLPQAMERLAGEETLFVSMGGMEEALCRRPFDELWEERISALGLPDPEREALRALGRSLSSADADRELDACQETLWRLREEAGTEAAGKCRLSAALGFCAGALAVILLL